MKREKGFLKEKESLPTFYVVPTPKSSVSMNDALLQWSVSMKKERKNKKKKTRDNERRMDFLKNNRQSSAFVRYVPRNKTARANGKARSRAD